MASAGKLAMSQGLESPRQDRHHIVLGGPSNPLMGHGGQAYPDISVPLLLQPRESKGPYVYGPLAIPGEGHTVSPEGEADKGLP